MAQTGDSDFNMTMPAAKASHRRAPLSELRAPPAVGLDDPGFAGF